MKKYIITLAFIVLKVFDAFAQNTYDDQLSIHLERVRIEDRSVHLSGVIDPAGLNLDRNDMIVLTPSLRSLDGTNSVSFPPIMISGQRRAKAFRRSNYFGREKELTATDNFFIPSLKEWLWEIPLKYTVPFEQWMNRSQMVVEEQIMGCYRCENIRVYPDGRNSRLYLGDPLVTEVVAPEFLVAYIIPPVEEVKIQSETYSARLHFLVNRSEIMPNIRDNARTLAEADEIIRRIRNDSLLSVRKISVCGFASPEGNSANNLRLSNERAYAFVKYLQDKHQYYAGNNIITWEGRGEDWEGLRRAVEQSQLANKELIINTIDNYSDSDVREKALKSLRGGTIYRMLLDQYYPPLRRNEYTIEYQVRGFSAQEARIMLRTRPQLLSLNELFMAAQLYPPGSTEFKEVFDIAVRLYPDSPVAQLNVAATEIRYGTPDLALARLRLLDNPQAWNNLGVVYCSKKQYEQAEHFFERAALAGLEEARENIKTLRDWYEVR